jgi:hypothetical protein
MSGVEGRMSRRSGRKASLRHRINTLARRKAALRIPLKRRERPAASFAVRKTTFEDPVRAREHPEIELGLPAKGGDLRLSKQCFRNETLRASDQVLREGHQLFHGGSRERRVQDGTLVAGYRASRERDQVPSVGRWKQRLRHQVRLLRYVHGSSPCPARCREGRERGSGSLGKCHAGVTPVFEIGEFLNDIGGAPGRTRICDQRLRRPPLYPTELRAHYLTVSSVYATRRAGSVERGTASAVRRGPC